MKRRSFLKALCVSPVIGLTDAKEPETKGILGSSSCKGEFLYFDVPTKYWGWVNYLLDYYPDKKLMCDYYARWMMCSDIYPDVMWESHYKRYLHFTGDCDIPDIFLDHIKRDLENMLTRNYGRHIEVYVECISRIHKTEVFDCSKDMREFERYIHKDNGIYFRQNRRY